MKKIMITGSSGLVGSAVIAKLLQEYEEYEIFAATSKELTSTSKKLHYIPNSEIETVMGNEKPELLLQLAFPRNVKEDQWAEGIKFSSDILWLAKKYKIKRVINISSQSIYGWGRTKASREGDGVVLNSPYTTGKYFSELLTENLFEEGCFTNIRLSTVIAPSTKERVPNKLFAQITAGKNLTVKGGTQIFSFLDVRDAAAGLAAMISTEKTWRPLYNLGTAEYATLLEIAEKTAEIGKKHGYVSSVTVDPAEIALNNMLDVTAMKEDFGWEAKYTLQESLEHIFAENYLK